jgi:hypothetical protein
MDKWFDKVFFEGNGCKLVVIFGVSVINEEKREKLEIKEF